MLAFLSCGAMFAMGLWALVFAFTEWPGGAPVPMVVVTVGVMAVTAWVAYGRVRRGPETFVFDRAAEHVLHEGRPVLAVRALRRVDVGPSRNMSVQLRAEGGKVVSFRVANLTEALWVAKDIGEHLGIPWGAPDVWLASPYRDSWRRGGAFLTAAAGPVAAAAALVVLAADGHANPLVLLGLSVLFVLAIAAGRWFYVSIARDVDRGVPSPPARP